MFSQGAPVPSTAGFTELGRNSRGPDVVRVQRCLRELGHLLEPRGGPGPVDGIYGPHTMIAVQDWQELAGHEASGRITVEQMDELGPALASDYDLCTCSGCGIKWRFGVGWTCFAAVRELGPGEQPPEAFDHRWQWFGRPISIVGGAELMWLAPVGETGAAGLLQLAQAERLQALEQIALELKQDHRSAYASLCRIATMLGQPWPSSDARAAALCHVSTSGPLELTLRNKSQAHVVVRGSLFSEPVVPVPRLCDGCGRTDGTHKPGCPAL